MVIKTRYFGEIEVDKNKIIKFENGILGFEHLQDYLFMTSPEEGNPFCWLQSIQDIDIVFTIIDIFKILPEYNPTVEITSMKDLGEFEKIEEDIAVYNIVKIPENYKDTTVNLKAPIVINLKTYKAKQIICNNEEYHVRFKIYDILQKAGGEKC